MLLLDQQKTELSAFPENPDVEERSFLFHLQPPSLGGGGAGEAIVGRGSTSSASGGGELIRVTLRSLLTGITAHHILLQLLGTILLQGTKHVVPRLVLTFKNEGERGKEKRPSFFLLFSLANLLLHGSIMPPLTPCVESAPLPGDSHRLGDIQGQKPRLPGMLQHLSYVQVQMLLASLKASYQVRSSSVSASI